jgi:hypothetical protein
MSKPFNIHDWQAKQKQLSEIKAQNVPGTAAFMGKNMRSGEMSNSEKNKASVDAFFKDLRDKEENPVVAKGDGLEITQDEMDKLHRDGRVRLKDGSLLFFPSKPLNVKEEDMFGRGPTYQELDSGIQYYIDEFIKDIEEGNKKDGTEYLNNLIKAIVALRDSATYEDDLEEASMTGTGASFNAGSGEGYMSPNAFGDDKKKKMKTYKSIGYKKV